MYKVYNSIEFVFSKAAARKKKKKKHETTVVSHTAENPLHILKEEINKHFPVIEGLPPRR